ncbi:tyrosine-type recombinase/integrase, partial [Streptomyces sp. NPDC059080]|uniref:tyrosine-type recombinase/integrase n=1 Tax=Streptomyces sp. NPDC059080 TaxID=3346718 RepID=UPI003676F579
PMPFLFQRRCGPEDRAIPRNYIYTCLNDALAASGLTGPGDEQLRYTPHDFRRIFVTDALRSGLPPHIAARICGHRTVDTTLGYAAIYPEDVINHHRSFIARRRSLRPGEEYREPTAQEWQDFLAHFEQMPRLEEIHANLLDRLQEAKEQGWLGEVAAIEASLTATKQKLAAMRDLAARHTTVHLGMPDFRATAGRLTTGPAGGRMHNRFPGWAVRLGLPSESSPWPQAGKSDGAGYFDSAARPRAISRRSVLPRVSKKFLLASSTRARTFSESRSSTRGCFHGGRDPRAGFHASGSDTSDAQVPGGSCATNGEAGPAWPA